MNALTSVRWSKYPPLHWCKRVLAITVGLVVLTGIDSYSTTVTTLGNTIGYAGAGTASVTPVFTSNAKFNFPAGIALDSSGTRLFMADYNNNAVRMVDNLGNSPSHTYSVFTNKDGIDHPIAVALDSSDNIYVLNYGSGTNGTLLEFSGSDYLNYNNKTQIATNASRLTNATAMARDASTNIYVIVQSNTVIRVSSPSATAVVGVITNAGTWLRGITVTTSGQLALTDAGTNGNGIWLMTPNSANPTNTAVQFTGFHGAGYTNGPYSRAAFNHPENIIKAGGGVLVVADRLNHRIRLVDASGTVTRLYGIQSSSWSSPTRGWKDGTVNPIESLDSVEADEPYGLAMGADSTVYVTEVAYHLLREATGTGLLPPPPAAPSAPNNLAITPGYGQISLTWSPATLATNYYLKRSFTSGGPYTILASLTTTSYTDTNVLNGTNYFYVVSASNSGGESPNSSEVSGSPIMPAAPIILSITPSFGQIALVWSPVTGASYYKVRRSQTSGGPYTLVASPTASSYIDTTVVNGNTYYYIVSAANSGGDGTNSTEASATVPLPPVPDPQIGYVTFPPPAFTSVFNVGSQAGYTFNNDMPIVIIGAAGSTTFYTYTNTPFVTNVPAPTSASSSAPVGYVDGLSDVSGLTVAQILPDLSIKAIGEQSGHSNSAVVSALFQFVVGNPGVNGNNAAQFSVTNITTGAQMWYTTDGTDPTNGSPSIGPVTNGATLSLNFGGSSNLLFKIRGFKTNYHPSGIVSNVFLLANYVPVTISFGFTSDEASSDFVGAPGQVFYAPVTLTTLPGSKIYSLQFSLMVTNVGAAPPVASGAFGFQSMLMKPVPPPTNSPGGNYFAPIPPYMFDGANFVSLATTNLNLNLLGVGWLERYSKTNLYNTLSQTLVTYSLAHDDLFPNIRQPNGVIVGGYGFTIPSTATNGQQYQIRIDRPSATDDGVGAPGSDVFIVAPTNGATAGGAPLNALKQVTVGQRKYVAGSVYPFRWFNAGDFGSSNIVNADVVQVFQSAIYTLNPPPAGSDFFDGMDSCGNIGVLDTDPADVNYNYYTNSYSAAATNPLFDGNDTTINQIAFGDTNLDVCDVYVTYRRSLDPSLTWYRRFWNNGQLVADTGITNHAAHLASKSISTSVQPKAQISTVPPQVNYTAGDIIGAAGQTVKVPITATILGNYPLRVLMLNLSVTPLDGSPALTSAVQFTANAALGTPFTTDSKSNGNYSAAWLNSTIAGLTGTASIGTLSFTIPAGATSAAYAVHFDHASASPNGLASFAKTTLTGLVTTSSRTNSCYHDGIPDSWRLRWFGTTNNLLSISNACPSGDGVNNWKKYIAGVDPSAANNFPSVKSKSPVPSGSSSAIHWPTVSGKQYVIERSTSLFPGVWSAISTNTGTGADTEFDDNYAGAVKFYRVRILP